MLMRITFFVSRKHFRDGFEIGIFSSDKAERAAAFSKIDQALDLISTFDSERYQQIKQDVKKILVFSTAPYAAQWNSALRMCVLDKEHLFQANISPAVLAATIVHEATHAHLERLGMDYTEDARARIERICMESEIAFAKRLPEPGPVLEITESNLKLPENFWTDDEFQNRCLEAMAELGKTFFLARYSSPILKWLFARKNRRKRKGEMKGQ